MKKVAASNFGKSKGKVFTSVISFLRTKMIMLYQNACYKEYHYTKQVSV